MHKSKKIKLQKDPTISYRRQDGRSHNSKVESSKKGSTSKKGLSTLSKVGFTALGIVVVGGGTLAGLHFGNVVDLSGKTSGGGISDAKSGKTTTTDVNGVTRIREGNTDTDVDIEESIVNGVTRIREGNTLTEITPPDETIIPTGTLETPPDETIIPTGTLVTQTLGLANTPIEILPNTFETIRTTPFNLTQPTQYTEVPPSVLDEIYLSRTKIITDTITPDASTT